MGQQRRVRPLPSQAENTLRPESSTSSVPAWEAGKGLSYYYRIMNVLHLGSPGAPQMQALLCRRLASLKTATSRGT